MTGVEKDGGTITESTKLPISLLIILGGVISTIAGVLFNMQSAISKVQVDVSNHDILDNKRVEIIEKKQDKYNEIMQSIDSRLSRIEGRMEQNNK